MDGGDPGRRSRSGRDLGPESEVVPLRTPGVELVRALPVFGCHPQHGDCELRFTDVRVPVTNPIGLEGDGFHIAQARLGPGRTRTASGGRPMTDLLLVTDPDLLALLGLGIAGSLYTVKRIACHRYRTTMRRRATVLPYAVLVAGLGALNAVLFLFPIEHRM